MPWPLHPALAALLPRLDLVQDCWQLLDGRRAHYLPRGEREPESAYRRRLDAAFASLCGVSPLPASSGKTNRHRLNRGGNRQANATLDRIVVVRLRWHEQTKAYASRRLKEGRSKAEIMRCLKRFIAREVFHTLLGRPPVRTAAA